YRDGILAGLAAIQEKVPLGIQEGEAPPVGAIGGNKLPASGLVWGLIIFLFVLSFLGRLMGFSSRGYRRVGRGGYYGGTGWGGGFGGRGGGGFGGGSWGGGGGGFGGGGASSSW